MKKNHQPYIKWYSSDFLAGVRGFSSSQIGIYTILINEMYERTEPLPINYQRLAWQCGCTKPTFKKTLKFLVDEGKITVIDGCLWNNRVEKEFQNRQKRRDASSASANARWEKANKIKGNGMRKVCEKDAIAMLIPEARSQKKSNTDVLPKEVAKLWNKICTENGTILKISPKRGKHIKARVKDSLKTIKEWEEYFKRISQSDFLTGGNDRKWKADFDWILNPNNCVKIREGKYDDDGDKPDSKEDVWRYRMREWKDFSFWDEDRWGFPPGHPQNQVPKKIIDEFAK